MPTIAFRLRSRMGQPTGFRKVRWTRLMGQPTAVTSFVVARHGRRDGRSSMIVVATTELRPRARIIGAISPRGKVDGPSCYSVTVVSIRGSYARRVCGRSRRLMVFRHERPDGIPHHFGDVTIDRWTAKCFKSMVSLEFGPLRIADRADPHPAGIGETLPGRELNPHLRCNVRHRAVEHPCNGLTLRKTRNDLQVAGGDTVRPVLPAHTQERLRAIALHAQSGPNHLIHHDIVAISRRHRTPTAAMRRHPMGLHRREEVGALRAAPARPDAIVRFVSTGPSPLRNAAAVNSATT